MSEELKPCAQCGGDAQTDFIEGETYIIECYQCGMRTGWEDSPQDAIAAWNRRTPAEQPAPASTGRANMDIWNAEAQALAEVPSLPPLPLGIGSGEFINVADAKAWGAACFAAGRGAAIRDYVSLQPVAARELDVEAERLTDTEIECLWHEACLKHVDLADSAIPDFARAIEAKVAARFRAKGGNTKPEGGLLDTQESSETRMDASSKGGHLAAPVSTEQAGDAWRVGSCACQACNPHMVGRMMFICATCGDKRCPHAADHRLNCQGRAPSPIIRR